MRHYTCFLANCAIVILLQLPTAFADHDMTCHPPDSPSSIGGTAFNVLMSAGTVAADEEFNLIVPGIGGAMSMSCSDSGGNALPALLPTDVTSAIENVPGIGQASRTWLFEPTSQTFREARIGLSAELPNFTKPDGTPLLTQYRESDLDFVFRLARTFTPGELFTVSTGVIDTWPGATLREMPLSFTLDELLAADPSRFPPYTGPVEVADIATIAVVPEPASAWLLTLAVLAWPCSRYKTAS